MPVELSLPPEGSVPVEPGDTVGAAAEAQPVVRERFLNRQMLAGLSLYGLFALTFSYFQVKGDGVIYYNLLRRFFGEHLPEGAYAYQFGSALWNAPFFLFGKGLGAIFGYQPRTFHVSFEEVSITVAANAALVLTLYLGWKILRELDLPRGPAVLLLTVFGSPLFYYAIFDPAGKHVVDTLVLTAAVYLLLKLESRPSWRLALGQTSRIGTTTSGKYQ